MIVAPLFIIFFFFNDTATTEIYTLSLHDALPIYSRSLLRADLLEVCSDHRTRDWTRGDSPAPGCVMIQSSRSEEHTSELQSLTNLVCRLLLEKKKTRSRRAVTSRAHPYRLSVSCH